MKEGEDPIDEGVDVRTIVWWHGRSVTSKSWGDDSNPDRIHCPMSELVGKGLLARDTRWSSCAPKRQMGRR